MIEVKNLTKKYGDFAAVRDVSFTMKKGTVYGFLGPNGAGKSTTMNIITGCLAATSGSVSIDGLDIYEDAVDAKRKIGYLPEMPPLYVDMTPDEYLVFVGRARGLRGEALYREVDRVSARAGLEAVRSRLIKNLSKGYRQRVGIAQALLGDPEIIILDEPTVGLDPLQIIEIRDLVRELGESHTVILSSHILSEISAVCDYVIIIAHGQIVASDTIENLVTMFEGKSYIDLDVRGDRERILSVLQEYDSIANSEATDGDDEQTTHLRLEIVGKEDVRETLFYRFAAEKLPILSMSYERVTLEKVFLELTGDEKKEASGHNAADGENDILRIFRSETENTDEKSADGDVSTASVAPDVVDVSGKNASAEANKETQTNDTPTTDKPSDKGDDYTPLFGGNSR